MPDRRRHRGRHPTDEALFGAGQRSVLGHATSDLSWLLGRGYSEVAATKLVGDRYGLRTRQRLAVRRCACADSDRNARAQRRVSIAALRGRAIALDGFNCIVTLEAALGGGLVLVGRDSCHRDLASVHGNYRRVEETQVAIAAIADTLSAASPSRILWYLDRPVSNSGRLGALIRDIGAARNCAWDVALVMNPDRALVADPSRVVASSDAWVLDHVQAWTDVPGAIIHARVPEAWILDLRSE